MNIRLDGPQKLFLFTFGAGLIILIFFFSPYIVDGASMNPTLNNREIIFINKVADYTDTLKRGDIVVLYNEKTKEKYVKRLIGLPGEKIEMIKDQLYVNGNVVHEPYLHSLIEYANQTDSRLTGDFGPIKVPKNHYFVMGDNRLFSLDSRNGLGFIHKSNIWGTSELVIYPFKSMRITN
ncbi:signal peptidase I [Bacillus sp. 31A1R]|uniref:Signal peptidase I n=1 Tax=Robertmurraya mangrovi TaxID=3098077 RepID=A0ABU5IWK2_9BACI|nr:signal peptidase I [Bacillus sp. 31A1R]MDZ5471522.1 signal peptidase I [Bacillus sp. 31A1R]